MTITSAEISQLISQQQSHLGQTLGVRQLGGLSPYYGSAGADMYGPTGLPQSQYGDASARFMQTMTGTIAPAAAGLGMAAVGADPFSIGAKGYAAAKKAGVGTFGAVGAGVSKALPYIGGMLAAGKALSYVGGQMAIGAAQQSTVQDYLGTQFGFQGGQARGMTRPEANIVSHDMRQMSEDFGRSFQEITATMGTLNQQGAFQGAGNVQQFRQTLRQQMQVLDRISREFGIAIQDATQFTQRAQMQGHYGVADQLSSLQGVRQAGWTTGLSASEVQQVGMQGTQISRMIGGAGWRGAEGMTRALTTMGALSGGMLSTAQVGEATGGLTGGAADAALAQITQTALARRLSSRHGRFFMAAAADDDMAGIDSGRLQEILTGQHSMRDIRRTARSRVRDRESRESFLLNEGDLRSQILQQGPQALAGMISAELGPNLFAGDARSQRRALRQIQRNYGVDQRQAEMLQQMAQQLPNMVADEARSMGEREQMQEGGYRGPETAAQALRQAVGSWMERNVRRPLQRFGAEVSKSITETVESVSSYLAGKAGLTYGQPETKPIQFSAVETQMLGEDFMRGFRPMSELREEHQRLRQRAIDTYTPDFTGSTMHVLREFARDTVTDFRDQMRTGMGEFMERGTTQGWMGQTYRVMRQVAGAGRFLYDRTRDSFDRAQRRMDGLGGVIREGPGLGQAASDALDPGFNVGMDAYRRGTATHLWKAGGFESADEARQAAGALGGEQGQWLRSTTAIRLGQAQQAMRGAGFLRGDLGRRVAGVLGKRQAEWAARNVSDVEGEHGGLERYYRGARTTGEFAARYRMLQRETGVGYDAVGGQRERDYEGIELSDDPEERFRQRINEAVELGALPGEGGPMSAEHGFRLGLDRMSGIFQKDDRSWWQRSKDTWIGRVATGTVEWGARYMGAIATGGVSLLAEGAYRWYRGRRARSKAEAEAQGTDADSGLMRLYENTAVGGLIQRMGEASIKGEKAQARQLREQIMDIAHKEGALTSRELTSLIELMEGLERGDERSRDIIEIMANISGQKRYEKLQERTKQVMRGFHLEEGYRAAEGLFEELGLDASDMSVMLGQAGDLAGRQDVMQRLAGGYMEADDDTRKQIMRTIGGMSSAGAQGIQAMFMRAEQGRRVIGDLEQGTRRGKKHREKAESSALEYLGLTENLVTRRRKEEEIKGLTPGQQVALDLIAEGKSYEEVVREMSQRGAAYTESRTMAKTPMDNYIDEMTKEKGINVGSARDMHRNQLEQTKYLQYIAENTQNLKDKNKKGFTVEDAKASQE